MKLPQKTLILTAGITLTALPLSAGVVTLFQNAGDLATNFTVSTTGTLAGTEVVSGVDSNLDGDAIRMYDGPDAAVQRTYLQYAAAASLTSPFKVAFDLYDSSTDNANLFRIGPSGANLALGGAPSLGIQMTSTGTVTVQTGTNISFAGAYTPGSRANIALYYNPTASTYDFAAEGGPLLAATQWAVLVDGAVLDNGTATSTGLSTWNGTEAQDMWFFTGTGGTSSGMNIQYDNITLTVVPEPSTYALMLGLAVLGMAWVRRRKS